MRIGWKHGVDGVQGVETRARGGKRRALVVAMCALADVRPGFRFLLLPPALGQMPI